MNLPKIIQITAAKLGADDEVVLYGLDEFGNLYYWGSEITSYIDTRGDYLTNWGWKIMKDEIRK